MRKARYFAFEPFCLDVLDERLWKDEASIPLGRKAFAVLSRLVSQPNQLVTKDDLLAAAWPDTAVSEAVLTTAMREIRAAVGDTARAPRFVQTVHGRGYRFIAPVAETDAPPLSRAPLRLPVSSGTGAGSSPARLHERRLVGRDAEWARLSEWYDAVQQGTRRIGFIAGEAGIGKTALVDAFAAEVEQTGVARIARGQCIEQYGAGEAYLPILEALGRLGHNPDISLVDTLRKRAPSWLAHLPSLAADRVEPSTPVRPERMLRELNEALEVLTLDAPLVLVLEDLHWSDSATLAWLASVSRRRDLAQLLVLATYRPVETLLHRTSLRNVLADLRHQSQTGEIVLDYLSRDAVATYLRQRCGDISGIEDLVDVLQRRTGGHPLFVASIVDELLQQRSRGADRQGLDLGAMAHAIPANVRQFIEHRFEQLSAEDRRILESASVAGDPFAIAAVAAGTSLSQEHVEARCAAWTRAHRILTADGMVAWPDGTLTARYRFRHALFHETAYTRISPEQRAKLHSLIGARLEAAYGSGASVIATELAMHFEQGRDLRKAVTYLEQAAQNALQRSAYPDAHGHLTRALKVLENLPEARERVEREAALCLLLAQVLETTKGWGADDVARTYAKARGLCEALGDDARLLQATWGLIAGGIVRAELRTTRKLAGELLTLAKRPQHRSFRMAAHAELGGTALVLGDTWAARRHFQLAEALFDPGQHGAAVRTFGMDLGIFARIWSTHLQWYVGYPDSAGARAGETVRLAGQMGHTFTYTVTLAYAAMLSQFRQDIADVERLTRTAIAHATEHGFPYYLAWGEVLRAWSLVAQGGDAAAVEEIRRGIGTLQASAGLRLPYYRALLADAYKRIGRVDEGLEMVSAALDDIRRTEERWWEAELHRLRGELVLTGRDAVQEAELSFRTAIDIARQQGAKVLELRAVVSLARLWQRRKKRQAARLLLAPAYGWFTDGFDTPDMREARLLEVELTT